MNTLTMLSPSLVITIIIVAFGLLALAFYKPILRVFGVVIIPENTIGLVNKKFVIFGANRTLPDGAIIALKGEAGFQADTLAPGIHYWLWPWQYDIDKEKFLTIEQGSVGVVEARDGKVPSGHIFAKKVTCDSFQNARKFLQEGGERGPQIEIVPPGTYRINTELFSIGTVKALQIEDNTVGIVTTKDGKPLPTGDIAGKEIVGHNMFQDPQKFIDEGGFKGLQEQVMLAGVYYVNPLFVTVEPKPMTEVPIAHAGVVIAYVGATGVDVSGETFKHGNLVTKGQKGVWSEPLDPGRYPINIYTHRVENVPTANIVLNWATGKTEAHKLDSNLSTITVRSADGFKFTLDVSQIIHVPRNDAPKVIARFGTMANLVTQVLEPTIGNYFRNAAQKSDVIDFLSTRQERQHEAMIQITQAVNLYNVQAVDTLIGDINPPDELMKTLTNRKIAGQEKITYGTQRDAQDERQKLMQAQALADTQAKVVDAERTVQIAEFTAKAAIATAGGMAEAKTINAKADAQVTTVNGAAEAGKILAIGTAEADVVKAKIASMEAGNYASIRVAEELGKSGQKLVPEVVVAGGDGNNSGSLVNMIFALMAKDTLKNGHDAKIVEPTKTK